MTTMADKMTDKAQRYFTGLEWVLDELRYNPFLKKGSRNGVSLDENYVIATDGTWIYCYRRNDLEHTKKCRYRNAKDPIYASLLSWYISDSLGLT